MSDDSKESATLEIGGLKFTGGKMVAVFMALSATVGSLYGAFEVYKDYMDMKEQIQSYVAPDLSGIEQNMAVMQQKVTEAVDYSRDIRNSLRDEIVRAERNLDRVEERLRSQDERMRELIDIADQRFENRRNQLATDTDRKIKDVEDRMNSRIQRALDNPLSQ